MEPNKCCQRFFVLTQSKRGFSASEILQQLQQAWEDANHPALKTIQQWLTDFKKEKRTSFDDSSRSGRPSLIDDEKIKAVKEVIDEAPNASLRYIENELSLGKNTVHKILREKLHYKKVCSVWVPHELSAANKQQRINTAKHIRHVISQMGDEAYSNIAIEDETWVFFQGRGKKEDHKVWIPSNAVPPKVIKPSPMTDKKSLVFVTFTCNKRFNVKALPYGTKIDSEAYVNFVHDTGEKWRKLRSNSIKLKELKWWHDNARPHSSKETTLFFERRKIEKIYQSPYSPDFNLCDRFLFSKMKKSFKNHVFKSHEEIEEACKFFFNSLSTETLKNQLDKLFNYCQLVIDNNGEYVVA
jgi:transposase